jgi:hypothetical protein
VKHGERVRFGREAQGNVGDRFVSSKPTGKHGERARFRLAERKGGIAERKEKSGRSRARKHGEHVRFGLAHGETW